MAVAPARSASSLSTGRPRARRTSSVCLSATTGPRTIAARPLWFMDTRRFPSRLFLNNTVNIDTGCVFGGGLTALRYPEREIVAVKATATYYEPAKPFPSRRNRAQRPLQHAQDDVLDISKM